jgi:hypothetical protein
MIAAPMFTATEKLKCLEREVVYRKRFYARMVAEKKMTEQLAIKQISIMEQIADDYRPMAEKELLL